MMQKLSDKILLAHGSGGKLSHELIEKLFFPVLQNPLLASLDDGVRIGLSDPEIIFTTDSYVVDPIFFPGGDIGKLAVSGTVNDLAVMGAIPKYLSLSLIIEEGFQLSDLKKIVESIYNTCTIAQVEIVTGDTKVVPKGFMDKIFINTAGIGVLDENFHSARKINEGDKIIINGTIGDHGTTIMASREKFDLKQQLKSDCFPLNNLIKSILKFGNKIGIMRDPTRGGVATTLNELATRYQKGILIWEDCLPFKSQVKSLCEILGLDPMYLANEGKVLLVVENDSAEEILSTLKMHPLGTNAQIIGQVVSDYPGKVVLKTEFGSHRIVDMLTGEQLPRIC
jgi:hydrogenase expression/formation protein HypE